MPCDEVHDGCSPFALVLATDLLPKIQRPYRGPERPLDGLLRHRKGERRLKAALMKAQSRGQTFALDREARPMRNASTTLLEEWRRVMKPITSTCSKLLVAAFGFVTTVSVARAQDWYYINRQPAPLSVAQAMAARGLPYGYYWLQANGNWGFEGNSDVVGNIYGRRPSLSERGLLYSPGELSR